MHASLKKSTMSVHEMREILGIKKTESYWLVKKHCFDTVLIGGKMRVVIESFENWYANQIHYHKMNGEQPGQHLIETSYSIHDIAEMLGVTESTVHDIIHRDNLPVKDINHHWRIEKSFFQLWYENQDHYRIAEDREKDRRWEEATMSFPEMGLLFGLDRNGAYEIARNNPELTIVTIAGRKRISKKSFERWYSSQTKYKKFDEMSEDEQKKILKIHACLRKADGSKCLKNAADDRNFRLRAPDSPTVSF